ATGPQVKQFNRVGAALLRLGLRLTHLPYGRNASSNRLRSRLHLIRDQYRYTLQIRHDLIIARNYSTLISNRRKNFGIIGHSDFVGDVLCNSPTLYPSQSEMFLRNGVLPRPPLVSEP